MEGTLPYMEKQSKCHEKLFAGTQSDKHQSGRPLTSIHKDIVNTVQNMFEQSPKKSLIQGVRESGLSRYTVHKVLKKKLNFWPWKLNYVQDLFDEGCNVHMEFFEVMLD